MKHFALLLLAFLASALTAGAQSIISMPVAQNPLFEVSTNRVEAAMPAEGMTLGADLVIAGGSGTYSYLWTDDAGNTLGTGSTLDITSLGNYLLTVSDNCDCHLTVEFIIQTTGIDSAHSDLSLAASGKQLLIGGNAEIKQITLVTTNGTMAAVLNTSARSIDVGHLPSATYIVSLVTTDGRLIVKKIHLN